MVKDHSVSERGNGLPPLHELLSPISSKGLCYTSRVALVETINTWEDNPQKPHTLFKKYVEGIKKKKKKKKGKKKAISRVCLSI